eukprot:TRINITY_DN4193_c0_g1_i2.p1 TRINITY_DN4193_c0_g1~~TRINITY_DN4193_c0_g1_i2.p1  ORF type:complete len:252 (-),score=41.89 TRINITY_DN4193_c0_g1_i2:29-784(-)
MQWAPYPTNPQEFSARLESLTSTPVKDIINLSKVDKWCPVYSSGSLFELIELFSSNHCPHRVPVWKDDKKIISYIISQSDVIHYLDEHLESHPSEGPLKELADKTLLQLGFTFPQNVITMSSHASVMHALWQMYYNRVYGIAILDRLNNLVANFSMSDLRSFGRPPKGFDSLLLPIKDFLAPTRPGVRPIPITCSPHSSYRSVIHKMAFHRIHRIWVTEVDKVVGVVTLTDIIRVLANTEITPPPPSHKPK